VQYKNTLTFARLYSFSAAAFHLPAGWQVQLIYLYKKAPKKKPKLQNWIVREKKGLLGFLFSLLLVVS